MSQNALALLQQHLKPITPSITGMDMELAATAVDNLVDELIAGQIDPNELMMLFHKDRQRLCTYLYFLPDQDKAKAGKALKLLAMASQADTAFLDDLTALIRQEDVAMNAHFRISRVTIPLPWISRYRPSTSPPTN